MGRENRSRRQIVSYDDSSIKPGEWISRGPYRIIVTNGGFEDVELVNIRSSWINRPTSRFSQADLDATISGKVPVGTSLTSLGEVKGLVGLSFMEESASNIFFVIAAEELFNLGFLHRFAERPGQSIYYLNSRYGQIISN